MIAYLDTPIVMWLMQGEIGKLSVDAQDLIESSDLLVSAIVALELELMYEKRETKLRWPDIFAKLEPEIGLQVCALPFERIANAAMTENWTFNPFDRIIVANAKANGLAYLISADEDIRKNYQRAVW